MTSTDPDQRELDRVAEEFAASIRNGENPSIDTLVNHFPQDAQQLRELLGSIAMIEGIKQQNRQCDFDRQHDKLTVQQLDDYRIVREIGRGGMGLVFEAIDQSLHRRVAIKVLPSGLLSDPRNLERFRREARAVARLRHPNIVSVFGVGQSEQYHYYVMDYIDGINLRQWIGHVTGETEEVFATRYDTVSDECDATITKDATDESRGYVSRIASAANIPTDTDSPEYFRWVSRVGIMISDALDYAHSQGTLHRDIKPANLLIDQQGVVSITDFGLAKVSENQAITRTGDILGTPRYMAPESFTQRYDEKSETYAVGLTLYELMTLRPAIDAASPAEILRKASQGSTVPPRKSSSHIPRDLETILLKALAVGPEDRYASAAELRDDLDHYLNDLPISARRSGLFERLHRWSRREPVVASLTLATFASMLILAVVSAIAFLQTKSALNDAKMSGQATSRALNERIEALTEAQQQTARAEANLSVAIEAFDQVRERIWQRGMMPDAEILGEVVDTSSGDVNPADAQILQSLLGFFDQLSANNSKDLRAQSAAAQRRVGDIYQRLGQLDEADRAYTGALTKYQSLAAENPADPIIVIEQARILNEQTVTASLQGQIQRASILFDQTIDLLDQQPLNESSADARFEYARAHALFASIIARAGFEVPIRRFRGPASNLNARESTRPAGNARALRSNEERYAISEAIDVLGKLVDQFPEQTRFHVALASAYRDQSKVAARAGRPTDAERAIKQSINHFEQLLSENQDSDAIRYELAKTLCSNEAVGISHTLRILRANSLSESLLQQSPTLPRYQALRAHVLETLAIHRSRTGRQVAAERNFRDALTLYDDLIENAPDLVHYRIKKSQALEAFADLKMRRGDRDEAISSLQQAMEQLQPDSQTTISPLARPLLQKQRQKLARIRAQDPM
jgi:serine/threonine protein kinase